MWVADARDIVIIILGSLYIILTIALIVGLTILYFKIRKLLRRANEAIFSVRKMGAYARGLYKGLFESVGTLFKKEGG